MGPRRIGSKAFRRAMGANLLALMVAHGYAYGALVRFDIETREPYARGKSYGAVGSYERFSGVVHFAVDPMAAANQSVFDLGFAPRNDQGLVEFSADFVMLAPADPGKGNGTLLFDVNNRGRQTAALYFNRGSPDFLMRRGFIVLSCGWIGEVLPSSDRLRLAAPVALENGKPLRGMVRAEMAPGASAKRLNVIHVGYGGSANAFGGLGAFAPTPRGMAGATLTKRLREKDARVTVDPSLFSIVTEWPPAGRHTGVLPEVFVELEGGFEKGSIYELIYEAEGPLIQGLGFAAIRDLISFLKYDVSTRNPLRAKSGRPAAERALGFGVSQSGRALRLFVYDGFNADEGGRVVFDGILPHVAGAGLGFFNHRFAAPTRHNTQHDNHLYPADMFPFTYGPQKDPFTERRDSILGKARAQGVVPKVVHVHTSAEYWHRSASLVHTDPLGQEDVSIPEDVRIYALGGSQHSPGSGSPRPAVSGQLVRNPNDYLPLLRALLVALDEWVRDGTPPPPSRYPRIRDGALGDWRAGANTWKALPGVVYPSVIQQPELLDYGPDFATERIITLHPPRHREDYRVRVPTLGPDNNEKGMLLTPAVAVPVGTYTGWNLRNETIGAETELLSLAGGYIPFAKTKRAREKSGDPRPALLERYKNGSDYVKRYKKAARGLVREGFLLEEDVANVMGIAEKNRSLFAP